MRSFYLSCFCLLMASCSTILPSSHQETTPNLTPVSFSDLPQWQHDNLAEALVAFSKSCARMEKTDAAKSFSLGGTYQSWQKACRERPVQGDNVAARAYFESYFTPYAVSVGGASEGLFTGYYEAALEGSALQGGVYQTPLRARPDDLVMVNLGEFRPELKGQRVAGRVKDGYLKPYDDRAAIENGKLPDAVDKPLYWVDSAVDAFFLQVQGSGVVTLPDGSTARVGYNGQNGHPYTAIGKELMARGALTKDNVSMQTIRGWLAENPREAVDVMRTNKSYVFFKKLDTSGPIGGEGVVLTPERSLAVDNSLWPYGMPVFLSANHPAGGAPLQRLMVAQDTGGAIKGAVRGDFFWGYGETAAHNAGLMQSRGTMWVLLPKGVDPKI